MSRSTAGAVIVVPRTATSPGLGRSCQVCGAQLFLGVSADSHADTDALLEIALSNHPSGSAWISRVCENCATLLVARIEEELTYLAKIREMRMAGRVSQRVMQAQLDARAMNVTSRERGAQLTRCEEEEEHARAVKRAEFIAHMNDAPEKGAALRGSDSQSDPRD